MQKESPIDEANILVTASGRVSVCWFKFALINSTDQRDGQPNCESGNKRLITTKSQGIKRIISCICRQKNTNSNWRGQQQQQRQQHQANNKKGVAA
ncbi:hypothetical protein ACLKA6_014709 [Drosophila palustris]